MRAYRARKRAAGLKNARHWIPSAAAAGFSNHALIDARSLAMHCLIARRIADNPALMQKAVANLKRWRERQPGAIPGYLTEWEDILALPLPQVLTLMTGLTEESVRLRQSSPFAGILSTDERKRVYDAFRA
jgi:uncharacterized protein YmfQ (DUF2313 family)